MVVDMQGTRTRNKWINYKRYIKVKKILMERIYREFPSNVFNSNQSNPIETLLFIIHLIASPVSESICGIYFRVV